MEPFGLFNLLKSLLPQTENSAKNQNETNEKVSSQMPAENANQGALGKPTNEETAPEPPPQPNAFLDFVSRHDERKKNIKKS